MIKRLSQSIREYKKPSLLAIFTVMIEVVMEVVIPLLIQKDAKDLQEVRQRWNSLDRQTAQSMISGLCENITATAKAANPDFGADALTPAVWQAVKAYHTN